MAVKLLQSKEVDDQLEEPGVDTLTNDAQWRQYRVKSDGHVDEKQRAVLLSLIRQASEGFGKA